MIPLKETLTHCLPNFLFVYNAAQQERLLKNPNTLSSFLHDAISHGYLFMFCRLLFLLKIIIQFVESWGDLWSYIYFPRLAHDTLADWTGSISLLQTFVCFQTFILLFNVQCTLCLDVQSDFFFHHSIIFPGWKVLWERESSQRWIRLAKDLWGESRVSVFLLLYVREIPLGRRWRGVLVRD